MLDGQTHEFEAGDTLSPDLDEPALAPSEGASPFKDLFEDVPDIDEEVMIDTAPETDHLRIEDQINEVPLDRPSDNAIDANGDTPTIVEAKTEASAEDEDNMSAAEAFTALIDTVEFPDKFTATSEGVSCTTWDSKGVPDYHHICGPLLATARVSHLITGDVGREITFLTEDDLLKTIIVWDAELHKASSDLAGCLARNGLWLGTDAKSHKSVVEYLNKSEPRPRKFYTETSGWIDNDAFILGSTVIGRNDVLIDDTRVLNGVSTIGTTEGWIEEIGQKCSGNPLLLFGVCLALAGPTFRMLDETAFGVHFFWDSSSGKTTLARIAASVYGPGRTDRNGFMQTWRATNNALEFAFAGRNDTLFVLDEIVEASPADIDAVTYMAANGQGKLRSSPRGGVTPTKEWRVPILSTGEMSVAERLAQGNIKPNTGQNLRLLSIPLRSDNHDNDPFRDIHGASDSAAFAQMLEHSSDHHAGHIGQAFIEQLCENHADHRATMKSFCHSFGTRFVDGHLTDVERRALRFFGVIAAAGCLAYDLQLLPQTHDEILTAVSEVFERWRRHNTGNLNASDNILRNLQAAFEEHARNRFVSDNGYEKFVPTHSIWGVWDDDDRYCWFRSNAFKEEILNGRDERSVYSMLVKVGVVIPRHEGETTWPKRFPDLFPGGQVRCLKIDVHRLQEVLGNHDGQAGPSDNAENKPNSRRPNVLDWKAKMNRS